MKEESNNTWGQEDEQCLSVPSGIRDAVHTELQVTGKWMNATHDTEEGQARCDRMQKSAQRREQGTRMKLAQA